MAYTQQKSPPQQKMQEKWLNLAADGQEQAELERQIYGELKKMARGRLSMERPDITLNATGLVHEAWMRLEKSSPEQWRDKAQFFASAAEAMRRILVESARRRLAAKRGGGERAVPLEEIEIADGLADERLMEVHEVLDKLESEDPLKARIVKLRFFCGFGNDEIATILDVNEKTVRRHWTLAKVLLFRLLNDET